MSPNPKDQVPDLQVQENPYSIKMQQPIINRYLHNIGDHNRRLLIKITDHFRCQLSKKIISSYNLDNSQKYLMNSINVNRVGRVEERYLRDL